MTRALDTLARLRRMQTEQSRRTLGQAVAQERQAAATLEEVRSAPLREARASSADAADPLAYAFAAWLPVSAQAIAEAHASHADAQADSHQAMAALAARRASLEAVETLICERNRLRLRLSARRAQSRLDELGHRLG